MDWVKGDNLFNRPFYGLRAFLNQKINLVADREQLDGRLQMASCG